MCPQVNLMVVERAEVRQKARAPLCTDRWSSQFENNYLTEMCSGSEPGSRLRLIDFCITQLQA